VTWVTVGLVDSFFGDQASLGLVEGGDDFLGLSSVVSCLG
jgi:hypothetical protein